MIPWWGKLLIGVGISTVGTAATTAAGFFMNDGMTNAMLEQQRRELMKNQLPANTLPHSDTMSTPVNNN